MLEGLYCGEDNCYDLLGVTRDSEKNEIAKSYRTLARKWHPDKHKVDKEAAVLMFQKIATAYETLKDEESRNDYDYMLDNPEEFYSHYYRYYRRKAPKVDVSYVIVITISVISIIQYLSSYNNYKSAIEHFATIPKYRIQALQYIKDERLIEGAGGRKKKDKSKSKEELKEEEETLIKAFIREKLEIRGSYSKPNMYDILWLQLLFLPYYLFQYLVWYVSWVWRFNIRGMEYDTEAKHHLIRKNLGMSQLKWEELDKHEVEVMVIKELWKYDNYLNYKKEQEAQMREQMADSARHKQYRRYMKDRKSVV